MRMDRSTTGTLHELLIDRVERAPEQVVAIDHGRQYTYRQLLDDAARLAAVLSARGLEKGDRLGILVDNGYPYLLSVMCAAQLGAVFVGINPKLKAAQISHIVNDCGIRFLVGSYDALGQLPLPLIDTMVGVGDQPIRFEPPTTVLSLNDILRGSVLRVNCSPAQTDDLATIVYTSGSTGPPKGVLHSHSSLVSGARIISTYLDNTMSDRVLAFLPLSFTYGLSQFTTMLRVGGTLVFGRSKLPNDLLCTLRQHRVTGLPGVPLTWRVLLRNRKSLAADPPLELRYLTNSGGTISKSDLQELRDLLPTTRIYLMYGQTETLRSTYLPHSELDRGNLCIGRPIPETSVWIVDDKGKECGDGKIGELIHAGPTAAQGYWRAEDGNSTKFCTLARIGQDSPSMRIVRTGDLAKKDSDGFLHFVGRTDDQRKRAGYRISLAEIETILSSIPDVEEAAVFEDMDPILGNRLIAYAMTGTTSNLLGDDIRRQCSRIAPPYLVPDIVFVTSSDLPRTATGKVDKLAIRKQLNCK